MKATLISRQITCLPMENIVEGRRTMWRVRMSGRRHLKGWQSCVGAHAREDALSEELVRLSRQAHETFGLDTTRTLPPGRRDRRQNPNDPRDMAPRAQGRVEATARATLNTLATLRTLPQESPLPHRPDTASPPCP